MKTLTIAELEAARELGLRTSEWLEIDQQTIDLFADANHDQQWIHVDRQRAAAGPFGSTIAHGYLSLSLIPNLMHQMMEVTDAEAGINYGINRIRFTAPVPAGSGVRLHATIPGSEHRGPGVAYRVDVKMEIEGEERPAFVGEVMFLIRGAAEA